MSFAPPAHRSNGNPVRPDFGPLPSLERYWAFISYSHSDVKVAVALQRAIETYRLPRRLVGTTTSCGRVPPVLKPVFRDRDELQANTDLKTVVRDALARSRFLIVVCSPEAARSAWVNQEILEFKKLHGESRVLALIARGEPFASEIPGRADEECFPPALRAKVTTSGLPHGEALEPIAADRRPHADGPRRATLKLIAGMVGVGADTLIHRDATRRARRLAYLTIASLVGMAIMAALSILAIRSRDEARRQHARAEDLVEFMLGDLRKRLDAVGRLDVFDSVGNKAVAYYALQDPDLLDANSLGRRARALHLIGELREQRGQLEAAETAFQRAAETTAQLLAAAPHEAQRIFDHAQSVYWLGHLARMRGQSQKTEERFREYMQLSDRLVKLDSRNMTWQMEAAYARGNVAVALLDTSRPDEALVLLEDQRKIRQRIAAGKPELNFELANTFGSIAKAHEMQGLFGDAISDQFDKRRALEAVPNGASDRKVQRAHSTIDNDLARLNLVLGRTAEAQAFAAKSVDTFSSLVRQDQTNKIWLEQLCLARITLAETKLAAGDRAAARELITAAATGIGQLLAIDPKVANWQVRILGLVLQFRARLATPDERSGIIRELEAYLASVKDFSTGDRTLTQTHDAVVGAAETQLASLYAAGGETAAAAAHGRAVVNRLADYATTDLQLLTTLATAQWYAGNHAEARALAQRIAATPYRHPAFVELQQLLAGETRSSVAQP